MEATGRRVRSLSGDYGHGPAEGIRRDFVRLRGMDDGSFWFTLFHELAHVALHGKRELLLELEHAHDDDREREADAWARDRLIPREPYHRFLTSRGAGPTPQALPLSPAEIQAFAREVSLPAGVVVTVLQRVGWLPHSEFNHLKVRLAAEVTA